MSEYQLTGQSTTSSLQSYLEQGGNINAENAFGMRPVEVAIQAGNLHDLREIMATPGFDPRGARIGTFLDVLRLTGGLYAQERADALAPSIEELEAYRQQVEADPSIIERNAQSLRDQAAALQAQASASAPVMDAPEEPPAPSNAPGADDAGPASSSSSEPAPQQETAYAEPVTQEPPPAAETPAPAAQAPEPPKAAEPDQSLMQRLMSGASEIFGKFASALRGADLKSRMGLPALAAAAIMAAGLGSNAQAAEIPQTTYAAVAEQASAGTERKGLTAAATALVQNLPKIQDWVAQQEASPDPVGTASPSLLERGFGALTGASSAIINPVVGTTSRVVDATASLVGDGYSHLKGAVTGHEAQPVEIQPGLLERGFGALKSASAAVIDPVIDTTSRVAGGTVSMVGDGYAHLKSAVTGQSAEPAATDPIESAPIAWNDHEANGPR